MIDNLHELLVNPSSLDEVSVSELEGLIIEFPAVGLFKVLLAKKMNRPDEQNLINQINDPVMISMYINEAAIAGIDISQTKSDLSESFPMADGSPVGYIEANKAETMSDSSGAEALVDVVQSESNITKNTQINLSVENQEVLVSEINADQERSVLNSDLERVSISKSKYVESESIESEFIDSEPIQKASEDSESDKASKNNKVKIKKQKTITTKSKDLIGLSAYGQWLMKFKDQEIEAKIEKARKKSIKKKQKDKIKKNAMLSVTKSNQIISEPLANILAAQGHLDEAKKMFEQLMLRNPEKSSYFAAQINNLIKFSYR